MGADTEQILQRIREGHKSAVNDLLMRHSDRLRRMVASRMDDALRQRIDPSDVIQETLADAQKQLPDYLRDQPIAFYPWLRAIAWKRLVDLYRQHILADKRSVYREVPQLVSADSMLYMADQLVSPEKNPAEQLLRKELLERLQSALQALSASDREIVVLRHIEQLSVSEVAETLGIAEGTVKSRHFRALLRIRMLLEEGERERHE